MSSITGGRHDGHGGFSKFVSLVSGRPRVSSVGTFIYYYGALISAMHRRAGGPCQGRNICVCDCVYVCSCVCMLVCKARTYGLSVD